MLLEFARPSDYWAVAVDKQCIYTTKINTVVTLCAYAQRAPSSNACRVTVVITAQALICVRYSTSDASHSKV
eukprot:10082-Heterococcus_DN1.PRE.1